MSARKTIINDPVNIASSFGVEYLPVPSLKDSKSSSTELSKNILGLTFSLLSGSCSITRILIGVIVNISFLLCFRLFTHFLWNLVVCNMRFPCCAQ